MLLSDFKIQLASQSGISDEARLLSITNLALQEIWNHSDFPGSLQEQTFMLGTDAFITLPWYVLKPRMCKGSDRVPIKLNSMHPAYLDSSWWQSPWTWRRIRRTPIHTNISNASPIAIRRSVAENLALTFTFVGETDLASQVYETVTLPARSKEVMTINRFTDLVSIEKNLPNTVDIFFYDADEVEIGMIANHQLVAHNTIIQIRDKCANVTACCFGSSKCMDVLFKLRNTGWYDFNGIIDEAMYPTLLYKALEIARLNPDTPIETLAAKAAQAYLDAGEDQSAGDEFKFGVVRPSGFTTSFSGYL